MSSRLAPSVGFADTSPVSRGRTAERLAHADLRSERLASRLGAILPCEAGEGDHAQRGGGGVLRGLPA